MNQESNHYDGPGLEWADGEIESLLAEAYDAPVVPKSLQKRLDRIVAQHWGVPSDRPDANSRVRVSRRGQAAWKAWSVAASLAMAVLLVVAFWGDRPAYGWSAMIEALSRQPVIQVEAEESNVRWLSLSERVLGQRSSGVAQWIDFGRRVILRHQPSESHVLRAKLEDVSAAAHRERLVLSLLLDEATADAAGLQLPDLKVIDESWSRDGDRVRLDVVLGNAHASDRDERTVALRIWLDPESQLPLASQVRNRDGTVRTLDFSYPKTTAAELIARVIPSELPIVDFAHVGDGGDRQARSDPAAVNPLVQADLPSREQPAQDEPSAKPDQSPPDGTETSERPPVAVLTGAASLGWSPVPPLDLPPDEVVRRLNATLEQLWNEKGVEPTSPATDEELLRRVYLDLAGRTPTVHEVRSYLEDASPDRYQALVDRLLASRDHATHLATVWRNFLLPEGVDLSRFGGIEAFDKWLSDQFSKNVSYDTLVRELLLAEGRLTASGPLLFYAALKLDADQLAAKSARVFLGLRLDCAQCHDDPFEPWTQEDFWSYAAFFARISRPQAELESVSTVMRVRDVDRGEVTMPDSTEVVLPRLLDGSKWEESPQSAARRQQLARWLTASDNPYFAKAAVNRVWAHMFGRGIVDPVDGFGKQNVPASPELLDLLAGQFIHDGFDLRGLFRTVALSRAYQLSSGSDSPDPRRHEWFAQQNVKILTAEQLYDCITVATLLGASRSGELTLARMGDASRAKFLQQFQTLSGNMTEYQAGIPQALTLMNGMLIGNATGLVNSGLLKSLEAPFFTDEQRVEVIYLSTLSRRPSPAEWEIVRQYLESREADLSVLEPLGDILWALLNSAEFAMNH